MYKIYGADGRQLFVYKKKTMDIDYNDSIHSYDELKFVRIISGTAIWRIGYERYTVSDGDTLVMSRLDIRKIDRILNSPFIIEQINFVPAFLLPMQEIAEIFIKRDAGFRNLLEKNKVVTRLFDEIVCEIENNAVFKDYLIKVKLAELIIEIARLSPRTVAYNSNKLERINNIIDDAMKYIGENFDKELSLKNVSSKFFLSPSYFSRLFKQYSGMTFQEYVATVRVKEVISLLDSKNINVLDAAIQCGFTCSSGFYKTFKHIVGSTPKEFKK